MNCHEDEPTFVFRFRLIIKVFFLPLLPIVDVNTLTFFSSSRYSNLTLACHGVFSVASLHEKQQPVTNYESTVNTHPGQRKCLVK